MWSALCALALVAGCSVPMTTVVYPGGPVIRTPSEVPLECPVESQPVREDKRARGTLAAAREWCELPSGIRHGPYRDYDGRSTMRERGTYEHGKKVGGWVTVGATRPFLVQLVQYKDGVRHGPLWAFTTCSKRPKAAFWSYAHCSQEQIPVIKGTFRDDKRHGPWTFYIGGQVIASVEFDQGKRHGAMGLYRRGDDGNSVLICSGRWEHDHPVGKWTERETGSSGRAEGGYVLSGDVLKGKWPEDSKLSSHGYFVQHYRAGLAKHGVWTEYAADGGKESGPYERGKRHGPWTSWYPGGGLRKKQEYRLGELEGPHESWSVAGTRQAVGAYSAGKKHGDWKLFHPNGALAAAGRYAARVKVGVWIESSPAGIVLSRDNYVNGIKQKD